MTEESKGKEGRIAVRIPINLHKALKYAKIETEKSTERIVEDAIRQHMISLGFLKEEGAVNTPETIVLKKPEEEKKPEENKSEEEKKSEEKKKLDDEEYIEA